MGRHGETLHPEYKTLAKARAERAVIEAAKAFVEIGRDDLMHQYEAHRRLESAVLALEAAEEGE